MQKIIYANRLKFSLDMHSLNLRENIAPLHVLNRYYHAESSSDCSTTDCYHLKQGVTLKIGRYNDDRTFIELFGSGKVEKIILDEIAGQSKKFATGHNI